METTTVIETQRLLLREMTPADRPALCRILQDSEVMYAYNGPFSDEEVDEWLERQLTRYRQWGYGLWAVVLKATGEMIGQCGLTLQQWNGREMLEAGYLFQRSHWHQGYATEAASACMDYAFGSLNSPIRGNGQALPRSRDAPLALRQAQNNSDCPVPCAVRRDDAGGCRRPALPLQLGSGAASGKGGAAAAYSA